MNWRFMDGCSCILDHNCPVSLRVYASRIPPYITMQRVSRVDKRTRLPFRRSLFFLKKKGREEREGNEKKKNNYRQKYYSVASETLRKLQPIRQLRDRKERSLKNFSLITFLLEAYFSRSRQQRFPVTRVLNSFY